jgi:hypothetical protein
VGELRSPHSADPDFDSSYIAWDTYSVVRAIGWVIGGQQCAKPYLVGLPRQDTRQPIVGLESNSPNAPLIASDHSQQGKSLWRDEGEDTSGKLKIRPGSYFQGSIYAYNAVREDKQIKSIKHETGGKMFTRAKE